MLEAISIFWWKNIKYHKKQKNTSTNISEMNYAQMITFFKSIIQYFIYLVAQKQPILPLKLYLR